MLVPEVFNQVMNFFQTSHRSPQPHISHRKDDRPETTSKIIVQRKKDHVDTGKQERDPPGHRVIHPSQHFAIE